MDQLAAAPNDPVSEPSKLDTSALYATLKDWWLVDQSHSAEWRREAKLDFGFVAGDQWNANDKSALEEQKRPVITFNRVISIIKAVAGIEINGRHDTVFLPRTTQPGVVKANELLTAASQWMADGCDAEDEQSEAFQDAIICGMGWTEPRIGYDEEPDGKYAEQKVDPLEMYWDKSARSKNLADARRVFRVRKMQLDEARDFAASIGAENVADEDLNASWAVGADTEAGKSEEEKRRRDENAVGFDPKAEVYIVHAQWIERQPYWRVGDETTGKVLTLDAEQFAQYKALAAQHRLRYSVVRQTRKVYKQAYLGGAILGEVTECPGKDRFTYQCITGERDRNRGTWFGLTKLMRDPQMWANKWLSQTLHILNTTAKGGILAERKAFKDIREAQQTYAQPDAITFVEENAIQKGMIMQKPGTGIPTAYVNLLEFAISSIRDVTGINLELLGMRDANQPGILEAQRKQAAMTILATMFDSLKRFRKNVGRVRLHYIQAYLADGRLIRVAGPEGMQMVPLFQQGVIGDYEVIIEDAPTAPNSKEETWAAISQLMPFFKGMMTPEVAVAILEYSPLPSKLVEAIKGIMAKPNPQAAIGQAMAKADLDGKSAQAERLRAEAEAKRVTALLDLAEAGALAAKANLDNAAAEVATAAPWSMKPIVAENVVDPMGNQPGPGQLPQLPMPPVQAGARASASPAPSPEALAALAAAAQG